MARGAQRVRRQSKHDLAAAVQPRYLKATRQERTRLLDEFAANTGYHRRYALTLLRHGRVPLAGRARRVGSAGNANVGASRGAAADVHRGRGGPAAGSGRGAGLAVRQAPGALPRGGGAGVRTRGRAARHAVAPGGPRRAARDERCHHRPAAAAVPATARPQELARPRWDEARFAAQDPGTAAHLHAVGRPAGWLLRSRASSTWWPTAGSPGTVRSSTPWC